MDNAWVPGCAELGHERHRVVRDGWRGTAPRRRQRWRCIGPDGKFHKLTPRIGRLEALTQACLDCENDLHASQGPGVARKYAYVGREVAAAMVSLSTGTTYADASRNIRTSVGRTLAEADRKLPWSDTGMVHGQLAATWVETYTDVVLAGDEDPAWPEVVLLDATDFWRWNGGGMKVRAFYVLCAYGYDVLPQQASAEPVPEADDPAPQLAPAWSYEAREAVGLDPFWVHLTDEELALLAWHAEQTGAAVPELVERPEPAWPKPQKPATSRGRLVRAWASKGNGEKDWVEFLESLPGTPRVVVCDGAGAIARAASVVWGTAEGSISSELVRCTWHMKKNLREHIETDLMRADRKPGTQAEKRARAQAHWLHELSGTALDSAGQWHDFREWAYIALGELWFGEQEVRASKTQPARMVPYDSATLNWLRANEQRVLLHIACRQLRPGPESTGPLEGAIVKLRTALASRVQSIGNREPTQLLLRLLTAGQRGQADHVQWAERVRAYVASVDGTPPPQRPLAQPLGTRTL